MVRVRRITWVSALIGLFLACAARIIVSLNDPGHGVFGAVLLGTGLIFVTAILTLVLTVVVAFPAAGSASPYGRRMWLRLPFTLLAAVVVMSVGAYLPEWWEAKHGMQVVAGMRYGEVPTAAAADCVLVKDGVFENEGIKIVRKGDRQNQWDKVLGQEEVVRVTWSGPCEYVLHGENSFYDRYVKITKVDDQGYDCLVYSSVDDSVGYAMRIDRSQ